MRRVAANFVPKLLNCDQKQHRMNIANEMLDSVRDDPDLLQRVITGDEAWIYGYDVETKAQSSQWKLPHEPRPKKARQVRSNVKVLLTVFFDCRGVVHHEFLPQGRTVNKEYYLQVMRNLREAIRQKRPDLRKNKNWLLHHDNPPAHTSLLVRDYLAKNNTLMMPQPPYSPDLAPCDFFLFSKLKRPMKGRRYATLDEIKTASKEELKRFLKNDFLKCFEDWKNRWHKCIIFHGDYFEGDKIDIGLFQIYMSSRTGFVVIPRFVPNKNQLPTDDNFKRRYSIYLDPYLPHFLKWRLFQRDMNPSGENITFNIKPQDREMEHKIVINDHLADLINSGRVQLKKGVQGFSKNGVKLEDQEIEIDTVIFATGYQVTLPFLPDKYTHTESLYKLITPIDLPKPTLGIIGMINALGPFFPLMEMQARWYVQVFQGNIKLPSQEEMLADRKTMLDSMSTQKQYGRWQNLCIEPISYTDELARQMQACPNQVISPLKDPALYICCNFGPALPFQYRLKGPHPWHSARKAILEHPCNKWIPQNFNQMILIAFLIGLIALLLAFN
ncbi:hypothetical protein LAZ67_22000747 [Cordylochernes scorpioides]|uniref:Flavin-containing monooxygenase n=1 Tax=Cordylochernes scorpioides TaxID=51811 RepID=A0ABY6LTB4_9ARAC|nr:hypothetical protein LAZ67_22000747 [Cordylochernes scorpioides]